MFLQSRHRAYCVALRLEPPIENGSSPWGVIASFTSRGFRVAATIDTFVAVHRIECSSIA